MHKSDVVQWMRVWQKAVALFWQDEEFKRELLQDMRKALQVRFQYSLPEHVDMHLYEVDEDLYGWREAPAPSAQASERGRPPDYDTLEWRHVWQRAVALSWQDESFRYELIKDVRKALNERFHYVLPEHVDTSMWESSGPGHGGATRTGGTWVLPRAQLVLTLPPPPESPEMEPLALVNLPKLVNMTLED
ncbi:BMA_0021/BMA_0022 family TOMM bacteriocin [Archangium sp.]|uniref:BMA_0021/BMA_0022 family TOMM bacteriocin n=1 Tax=Archangium sp. TaxID=1872627 RepID=UPI002D51F5C1|nr:BMA_0021/BMA_0022 family TOMM bacteriocin [Archangium sp.]HYO60153.1 BMA_0021/BMA_0022 family TOMM bacteriocin [Archangium sp.]